MRRFHTSAISVLAVALAATSVARADENDNNKADALVAAGFALIRAGQFDDGEKQFREALKVDKKVPGAYFGRALVAAEDKKLKRAFQYFERELKNAPDVGQTYNNLGVVQARRNIPVSAMEHFVEAANRLGPVELLFNNFGRTIDEYMFNRDLSAPLPPEVVRAVEVFERLEQQISLNPPKPGLVRFGAKWITAEELETIHETNRRLESEIQNQLSTIQQLTIEINTVQGEINGLIRELEHMRHEWYLYDYYRTHYNRNRIAQLEGDIERAKGRLFGLQDAVAVAGAAIDRLNAQKIRPSWFTEFVFLDWPGAPETGSIGANAGANTP